MATIEARTGYAPVGDLSMYYEIHGEGPPLVLLHGAYMTIDLMGPLLPGLARVPPGDRRRAAGPWPHRRRRPADHLRADGRRHGGADRPPRHRAAPTSWASAWAAASRCSWRSATRASSASSWSRRRRFASDGMHAVALEMFPSITPEMFAGSPIEEAYLRTAPEPRRLPDAGREADAARHDALRLAGGRHPRDRRADPDRARGLRRHPPRARRRAVRAARRRGDGRPGRAARSRSSPCSRAPPTSCRPARGCSTAPTGCWR